MPACDGRGRDRSDEEIAHDAAQDRRDAAQHQDSEQVHAAPHPLHRPAEGEDEGSDEVEGPDQQACSFHAGQESPSPAARRTDRGPISTT